MISDAFICDAVRTPFGRYGGALSSVRTDDLGAVPIRALMARHPGVDWEAVTDVLARHRDFAPDVAFERYTLTFNKNGYLRRMRPA